MRERITHLLWYCDIEDGQLNWRFSSHLKYLYWNLNNSLKSKANEEVKLRCDDVNMTKEELIHLKNEIFF